MQRQDMVADNTDNIITTTDTDITANDIAIQLPDRDQPKEETPHSGHYRRTLWLAPIVNAIYQAYFNGKSLRELGHGLPITITASTVTGVANLGLSKALNFENIDVITKILSTRKLPKDWKPLPLAREVIALSLACAVGVQGLIYDGLIPFNSVDALADEYHLFSRDSPLKFGWYVLGGFVSLMVIGNMLFGKVFETYKTTRKLVAWDIHFANRFSAFYSIIPGSLFGIAFALQNSLGNLQSMIYALNNYHVSIPLATLAPFTVLDAIGDFCLNGQFGIDAIDTLVGFLKDHCPSLKQSAYFTASTIISITTAYALSSMNINNLQQLAGDFHLTLSNILSAMLYTVIILASADEALIDIATLIVPLTAICDRIGDVIRNRCKQIASACTKVPTPVVDEEQPLMKDMENKAEEVSAEVTELPKTASINDETWQVSANHPQRLFSNAYGSPPKEPDEAKPSKRCSSRCHIL